jgi:hypothetical protein
MSKDELKSEINGMNYIDRWSNEDRMYHSELSIELAKRIKDEAAIKAEDDGDFNNRTSER